MFNKEPRTETAAFETINDCLRSFVLRSLWAKPKPSGCRHELRLNCFTRLAISTVFLQEQKFTLADTEASPVGDHAEETKEASDSSDIELEDLEFDSDVDGHVDFVYNHESSFNDDGIGSINTSSDEGSLIIPGFLRRVHKEGSLSLRNKKKQKGKEKEDKEEYTPSKEDTGRFWTMEERLKRRKRKRQKWGRVGEGYPTLFGGHRTDMHTISLDELSRELGTHLEDGLMDAVAQKRLATFGPNKISTPKVK